MQNNSLKEKTIRGVGWSAIDSFLGYSLAFLVGLILARLLSPAEYGLIGLTGIFITILNSFIDSGFSHALIRKKIVTDDDYNTMFITNMVMSCVMYIIIYFFSPYIAVFFNRNELIRLTRVMGLGLIVNAFSITQNTVLTKRIDFKTKTISSIISSIVSGIIGIYMAFMGFGVWALACQHLVKRIINTICLWIFIRWIPNFRFSCQSFKYMWGFGWKLLVSSILNNVWNQIYQMVVGKCYSPSVLGQYSRAREYPSFFSTNLHFIVWRTSFPVLSSIQDDKKRMLNIYRKIIRITMFVTAVCLISMGAIAEPMIFCLIGKKWYQAAKFLPLICISLSFYPLNAINLNMLKVEGRSDLFLVLEIIKKVLSIIPIVLGIYVGIYSMLIGGIINSFINFFLNSYYSGKKIGYSSWMQLKEIAPSYVLGLIIGISVYFIKYIKISYYYILFVQISVGIVVFFTICKIFKIKEYKEIEDIVIPILKKYISKKYD